MLAGEPVRSTPPQADTATSADAAADAEHRLIADQNIGLALNQLDLLAGWEAEPPAAR